jgi:hypothetical protein
MAAISLAKALKLKNRLAGRLGSVQADVQLYNSVFEEQRENFDVPALLKLRDALAESLVELKTLIVLANADIQHDIIELGELKAKLTWLAGINTRDGKERHGFQNTEVTYVAILKKPEIDAQRRELESRIDAIQDKLDAYNYTKKIEVSNETLNLGS